MIILSIDGQVQSMTQKAEQLLHQYLSFSHGQTSLPYLLQQWVKHQVSALWQPHGIPFLPRPLALEQEGRRLSICFQADEGTEQIYLQLEETQAARFSPESLEMLGLTKREAEVLFWSAKDESSKVIARRLGIREGTVKKHLENIRNKFGVQTRLAAVMYALEKLGLVNF